MRTLIRPRSRSGSQRGGRVDRSAGSAPGRRWVVLAVVLLAALIMLPNRQAQAGADRWLAGAAPANDAGSLDNGPTDSTRMNADPYGPLGLPGSSSSFDWAITRTIEASSAGEQQGNTPTITITDAPTTVTEGEPIQFTLTRTGDAATQLDVGVHRTETGRMLGRPWWSSARFPAGASTTVWQLSTANDTVAEESSVVSAYLLPGGGYQVGSPSSAVVTILDNDAGTPPPIPDPAASVWSATMTVADIAGRLGYWDGQGTAQLSDDMFTWGGVEYRVTAVLYNPYFSAGRHRFRQPARGARSLDVAHRLAPPESRRCGLFREAVQLVLHGGALEGG